MGRRQARIKPADVLADPALFAAALDEGRLGILVSLLRLAQGTPQGEQLVSAIVDHHLENKRRIDHREKWSMISYAEELGMEVAHLNTGHGDYAADGIAFERKAEDFAPSVFDRRIFKQMSQMKEQNDFSFLVVTKEWNQIKRELAERGVSDEVMIGFIASCMAAGYPPVFVPNEYDASRLMSKVMDKIQDDKSRVFIPTPKKDTSDSIARAMVAGIPGLGAKVANALIDTFGSLAGVAQASIDDLTNLKGIGKKTAHRIYDVFHADSTP